jgi:hypothetical protein
VRYSARWVDEVLEELQNNDKKKNKQKKIFFFFLLNSEIETNKNKTKVYLN